MAKRSDSGTFIIGRWLEALTVATALPLLAGQ